MRLSAPLAALIAFCPSALLAQTRITPRFELILSPSNLKALREGDSSARRLVSTLARLTPLSPNQKRLWQERGWSETAEGWILRDLRGSILTAELGVLPITSLPKLLNPTGTPMPWERLEEVLRGDVPHGEALVELLALDLKADAYGELGGEASRTLKRLRTLEDWPWHARLEDPKRGFDFLHQRRWYGQGLSNRALLEDHLDALSRDPEHPGIQAATALLLRNQNPDPGSALEQKVLEIAPLPGQEWPPLPLLRPLLNARLDREQYGPLVHTVRTLERMPDRVWLTSATWADHCRRQAVLTAYRVLGDARNQGLSTLRSGLDDLHAIAAEQYPELAAWVVNLAHKKPDLEPDPDILALMRRKPRGLPPCPAPAPAWRIILRRPEAVLEAPALLPWSRSEVRVEVDLRLPADRDWELRLGMETLAQGPGTPDPQRLADQMRGVRQSRLDQATAAVERHPDALGPRRFRLRVLQARMADSRLETMLAEDARKALVSLDLAGLKFDENLWFEHGKRAVTDLEDHLRHWPLDTERWEALAFWSAFLPGHPGPAPLRSSLPAWKGSLPFVLLGGLTLQTAPAAPLSRHPRWERLLSWADQAWEALQEVDEVAAKELDVNLPRGILAQRERALRGVGRAEEARSFAQEGQKRLERLPIAYR